MRYFLKVKDTYKSFLDLTKVKVNKYIEIKFGNNILKTSTSHKLVANDNSLVQSKQLKIGMKLNNIPIHSIKLIDKEIELYDFIDVEGDRLYESNGILHHNCKFLSSDALLINSETMSALNDLVTPEPILVDRGINYYKEITPRSSYIIGCDVSEGVGGDYSTIQVISLPELEQVAEFRSNTISPNMFYLTIKSLINYIYSKAPSSEIYWSYENNTVGNAITALYMNDEESPNGDLISDESFGFKTGCQKTKIAACLDFKSLIEREDGIKINSRYLISELNSFCISGTGFAAKKGYNDDLISAMLIVVRILKQLSNNEEYLFNLFYNYADDINGLEPMAVA